MRLCVKALAIAIILILTTGCTEKAPYKKIKEADPSVTVTQERYGEKTGVWSPDSRWVAVTTVARTWIDTVILDTVDNREYEIGIFKFITEHAEKYGYSIGKNQSPDPYVNFMEWCPDSKKVLLSYSFTDDYYSRHTGVAVFNLETMAVDWIMKMGSIEGDHAEINKPANFSWSMAGYGIEEGLAAKDSAEGGGNYNR